MQSATVIAQGAALVLLLVIPEDQDTKKLSHHTFSLVALISVDFISWAELAGLIISKPSRIKKKTAWKSGEAVSVEP